MTTCTAGNLLDTHPEVKLPVRRCIPIRKRRLCHFTLLELLEASDSLQTLKIRIELHDPCSEPQRSSSREIRGVEQLLVPLRSAACAIAERKWRASQRWGRNFGRVLGSCPFEGRKGTNVRGGSGPGHFPLARGQRVASFAVYY